MLPDPFNSLGRNNWTLKTLQKGEFVFRQGDDSFAMFYLQTGVVQLERHTSNGGVVIIHKAIKAQTFAEASLFSDTYHCDALVKSDAEIAVFNKEAILNAMKYSPEFSNLLLARFARQVQSYRHRLEILAIYPAIERVYASIAAGMLTSGVMSLATEIGLSHEATYRALTQLVRDGRLTKTGRGSYALR